MAQAAMVLGEIQAEVRRLAEQQTVAAAEVVRLQAENRDLDARLNAAAPTDGAGNNLAAAPAAATIAAVAAQPRTIIDTKGIAKPKDFDNKEEKWAEFAFKYENWVCAVIPESRLYLRWVEMEADTIDEIR